MDEFPHGKGDHKNHLKLYTIILLDYTITGYTLLLIHNYHHQINFNAQNPLPGRRGFVLYKRKLRFLSLIHYSYAEVI